MAIINGILTGKARGKVGEVVLSQLKGQTIMKAHNAHPAASNTPDQAAQRFKMKNVVLAWQFLSTFVKNFFITTRPLESSYNAFVRMSISLMSSTVLDSGHANALLALESDAFAGNMNLNLDAILGEPATVFSWESSNHGWVDNMSLSYLVFHSSGKVEISGVKKLSKIEFEANTVTINTGDSAPFRILCYISIPSTKECTQVVVIS